MRYFVNRAPGVFQRFGLGLQHPSIGMSAVVSTDDVLTCLQVDATEALRNNDNTSDEYEVSRVKFILPPL